MNPYSISNPYLDLPRAMSSWQSIIAGAYHKTFWLRYHPVQICQCKAFCICQVIKSITILSNSIALPAPIKLMIFKLCDKEDNSIKLRWFDQCSRLGYWWISKDSRFMRYQERKGCECCTFAIFDAEAKHTIGSHSAHSFEQHIYVMLSSSQPFFE